MADMIFILIVAAAILLGRHFGFLKGLINLVCVVIASFGGYLLYPYFTSFLINTPLFKTINEPVYNYIIKNYLNGTPVENLNQMLLKYGVTTVEDLLVKMSEGVTTVIINIISIAVIFLIIRIALMAVKGIAGIVTKLPVISGLDKFLGMVTGIVSALLIIYLAVAVMMVPPCNSSEISRTMCENIDKSIIVKHVMDYNIFINYDSLAELGENPS